MQNTIETLRNRGTHNEGLAVDVSVERKDAYELLGLALQLNLLELVLIKKAMEDLYIWIFLSRIDQQFGAINGN